MIYLIREYATPQQLTEMLETLDVYVKLAEDIWGADWFPATQQVSFEALINIRPRQGNPSMMILDPKIRGRVEEIARRLLGDVTWTPPN